MPKSALLIFALSYCTLISVTEIISSMQVTLNQYHFGTTHPMRVFISFREERKFHWDGQQCLRYAQLACLSNKLFHRAYHGQGLELFSGDLELSMIILLTEESLVEHSVILFFFPVFVTFNELWKQASFHSGYEVLHMCQDRHEKAHCFPVGSPEVVQKLLTMARLCLKQKETFCVPWKFLSHQRSSEGDSTLTLLIPFKYDRLSLFLT